MKHFIILFACSIVVFVITYGTADSKNFKDASLTHNVIANLKPSYHSCVEIYARSQNGTPTQNNSPNIGTGFFFSSKGYLLTSYHVVRDADEIIIRTTNNKSYKTTILFYDELKDIAFLKADINHVFPYIPDLKYDFSLGEKVYSIGNRDGKGITISSGILSAADQLIDKTEDLPSIPGAILADTPTTSGYSGGPVVNSDGDVIGVSTAMTKISENRNSFLLAIPLYLIEKPIKQIRKHGYYKQKLFGVDIHETKNYPEIRPRWTQGAPSEGLLVERVTPGSPASKIGLKGGYKSIFPRLTAGAIDVGGDIITEVDNKKTARCYDLVSIMNKKSEGDSIKITFYRNNQQYTKEIILKNFLQK